MNNKNLFSVYSVVSNLAFAVAAPLLLFCWGGVRLIDYFGLPRYWRTVSMVVGAVVMICSFVRFFGSIIRVVDKQDKQAREQKLMDLTLGTADMVNIADSVPVQHGHMNKHAYYGVPQYAKLSKKEREKRLRLMRAKAAVSAMKEKETSAEKTPSLWEQFAEETADKKY